MPRLSDEKINEIRQSVDIVDVVGAYLPLTKKGRNYVTICPFHDDTNPSMSVSPEKQIYMCFVCHSGGNVFTFLKDYLKISYIEAVKKVAEIGRVDISEYHLVTEKKPVNQKLAPVYKMHEEANKIYSHYLQTKSGLAAKEYLTHRDIHDDIIETFEIGYALPQSILVKSFSNMGYSLLEMVRSGLVIESNEGYDRFTNRIMFPLHDYEGRVVGFSGRIFRESNNEAKYMNSPESEIFIKGENLYNYHRVKETVRQAGHVIICEGFMDVIAFHRAGIENAVAIMGTALTNGHMKALHRLTKTIYLCLDGDNAGRQATLKSLELLEKQNFDVRIMELPEGSDPDELLKEKGKEELQAMVKHVMMPISFKMNYYYEQTNMQNYEDKKSYLEKMIVAIADLNDEIDRDYYIDELEKRSGFNKQTIYNSLSKVTNQVTLTKQEPITYTRNKKLINKYIKAERNLLYYMLEDREVSNRYEKQLGFMFDNIYNIIAKYIVDFYRQNFVLEVADLVSSIEDQKIVQNIIDISQLSLPPIKEKEDTQLVYHYQVIDDYIDTIKERTNMMKEQELKRALEETFDPKQKAKILEEIIALKERN
ncbi:MAG: DNA primase [Coprobacillaceae bacterium]